MAKLKTILLLGKIPPPYMGPSIATEIILNSSLKDDFNLIHLDTRLNESLTGIGKAGVKKALRLAKQYAQCFFILLFRKPQLLLVPISQSAVGYKKDSVFIRLGRWFGVPTLVHLRGSNFLNFYQAAAPKLKQQIQHDLYHSAGAIVLGEKLRSIFQPFLPEEKIFVVPNGANYSFDGATQASVSAETIPLDFNEFNLIYLGNLQPSKGILDVIQAYVQVRSAAPTCLHIVGSWRDDTTRDQAFGLLQASGFVVNASQSVCWGRKQTAEQASKNIHFHSVLHGQAKLSLLASCDLMLFPPREPEGHPWVIVEAMAAGLAIIATDQGAITESVVDGANGFIVKPNNPDYIQERIQWCIQNPEQLKRMKQLGRQRYEEKFTEEKMVENLKRVFLSTLSTKETASVSGLKASTIHV